jgi:hypothetical protein
MFGGDCLRCNTGKRQNEMVLKNVIGKIEMIVSKCMVKMDGLLSKIGVNRDKVGFKYEILRL